MEHKIQDFYWKQTYEQQDPLTDSGDKCKVKSPITGTSTFPDDAAVIALAIQQFYDHLKQKKVL